MIFDPLEQATNNVHSLKDQIGITDETLNDLQDRIHLVYQMLHKEWRPWRVRIGQQLHRAKKPPRQLGKALGLRTPRSILKDAILGKLAAYQSACQHHEWRQWVQDSIWFINQAVNSPKEVNLNELDDATYQELIKRIQKDHPDIVS